MDTPRPKPKQWVRDFERWVPTFMSRVKSKAETRNVWRRVQEHRMTRDHPVQGGLVYQAALLLFIASSARNHLELEEQHKRTQNIAALAKRAEIAAFRGQSRRRGRGRPRLHAKQAHRDFLNAPWPIETPKTHNMRDALRLTKAEIGRDLTPAEGRKLIVQTFGPKQSPLNALWSLAQLRELAQVYGLRLGAKKIAHLCRCAGINVSARTLARYFASLKDDWPVVHDSLSIIRRGSVRRDKYPALFAPLRPH